MTSIGRPSGPASGTQATVLSAALDLLLVEGVTALSPQRLHQATGVSRSTIYRHWESPLKVLAALIDVAVEAEPPASDDASADVHTAIDQFCDRLRDKPVAAFLRALLSVSAADSTARELRDRYVNDMLAPIRSALRRAGVAPQDLDKATNAICAPALMDSMLLDKAVDRRGAHQAGDQFLTP